MGKKSTRTYTAAFKQQAVKLAMEIGDTRAAEQLGIPKGNLRNWKLKQNFKGVSQDAPSQDTEIKRLREENAELRKVNQILKAAAAFFSRDHLK